MDWWRKRIKGIWFNKYELEERERNEEAIERCPKALIMIELEQASFGFIS